MALPIDMDIRSRSSALRCMNMLNDSGVGGKRQTLLHMLSGCGYGAGRPSVVPQMVDTKTPTIVGKVSQGKNHREPIRKTMGCGGQSGGEYLSPFKGMVLELSLSSHEYKRESLASRP